MAPRASSAATLADLRVSIRNVEADVEVCPDEPRFRVILERLREKERLLAREETA